MRWPIFLILAYAVILVQVSLGGLLTVSLPIGRVGFDLVAATAVFMAFRTWTATEAMLACWVLGLTLDLTTAGGRPWGPTVVGPFAIVFSLLGGAVFSIREAFFRDRALTQVVVTLLFCLLAHALWITLQTIRLGGWDFYGSMLVQAAAIAGFTAVLAPLAHFLLGCCARWVFRPTPDR
jgi:hypothetical protein